ncbi:MAG: amidohydrolase family protein, partial [Clostridia bacterium]|nr:amidohydrolase family protein [Clostridia bacterium]
VELVAPEDIARFGELGVIAVINPYWFCKSAVWESAEQKSLGVDRSDRMFPAKSFYDAGARVTAASDYPVTGYPNPLGGIEMAVTRTLMASLRDRRTAEECTLNPAEALSMEQAIDTFTLTAAWSYDLDTVTGSIEAGKSADFVILDRDIFENAPFDAAILETWFQGKQVFRHQ